MAMTTGEERGILVYVTAPDRETAERIGREVVQRRLAACANIVPGIASIYWWEGRVQEESEAVLMLKSRSGLAERLREAIAALHPYTVPAISILTLERVHPPYWEWVQEETRQE